MTVFNDYEPEDAWHPDDPVDEQLLNLRHRLGLLLDSDDHLSSAGEELDLYTELLAILREHRFGSDRNVLRAVDLGVDIAHVRSRLP